MEKVGEPVRLLELQTLRVKEFLEAASYLDTVRWQLLLVNAAHALGENTEPQPFEV